MSGSLRRLVSATSDEGEVAVGPESAAISAALTAATRLSSGSGDELPEAEGAATAEAVEDVEADGANCCRRAAVATMAEATRRTS